jgi:hypothetical protein
MQQAKASAGIDRNVDLDRFDGRHVVMRHRSVVQAGSD